MRRQVLCLVGESSDLRLPVTLTRARSVICVTDHALNSAALAVARHSDQRSRGPRQVLLKKGRAAVTIA
jgi:hypothetical protein